MNCSLAEERILASLDAPLPDADFRALQDHLAACESCSEFQQVQLAADRALTAHFAEVVAEAPAPSRIRAAAFQEEPGGPPAWLPDLLNAAGVALTIGSLASLGLTTTYSSVVLVSMFVLVAIVVYPLLLMRTE